MKVLFCLDFYHPNTQGFVTGLLDAGHAVAMVAYKKWFVEEYDPRLQYSTMKLSRLNVSRFFKHNIKKRRYAIPSLRNFNQKLNDFQPDVVVVKYISAPMLFMTTLCRMKGIPVVLYSPRSPRPTRKHRVRYDALAALGLVPKHYFLVAVGGHTNTLQPGETCLPYTMPVAPTAWRRSYRQTAPLRILAVAKLVEARKNNAMLVRTLAPILRDGRAVLTIIGVLNEENDVYRNLLAEIRRQDVLESVTIRANVPRPDCLAAYEAHDLFVLPATREAAGMVILEALAGGLPTIASDTAGLSICVQDGFNGYRFRDGDFDDLREKVTYFLDNPREVARMGQNAVADAHATYSPEQFVNNFTALLEQWFGGRWGHKES